MNTAQKLRAKSGPVRVLSPADIARDYPLEASAEQLDALRAAVDADIVAVHKIASRVAHENTEGAAGFTATVALDVLRERITSGNSALRAAGWYYAAH